MAILDTVLVTTNSSEVIGTILRQYDINNIVGSSDANIYTADIKLDSSDTVFNCVLDTHKNEALIGPDNVALAKKLTFTFAGANTGGSSGGFNDGQSFYWSSQITALGNGLNGTPVTQDSNVFGADGSDVLDIPGSSLLSTGISAGDDFILQGTQGSSSDQLWFKTPGLYVVSIDSASIDGILIRMDYIANNLGRVGYWKGVSTADSGARGTMNFVVGVIDVAANDPMPPHDPLHSGATLSPSVFNNSGDTQDVWVNISVTRVI